MEMAQPFVNCKKPPFTFPLSQRERAGVRENVALSFTNPLPPLKTISAS